MSNDGRDDEWAVERIGPGSSAEISRQERVAWYRRHAAELRAKAETMKNPRMREQLLDVARQYETLANSIERLPPGSDG